MLAHQIDNTVNTEDHTNNYSPTRFVRIITAGRSNINTPRRFVVPPTKNQPIIILQRIDHRV